MEQDGLLPMTIPTTTWSERDGGMKLRYVQTKPLGGDKVCSYAFYAATNDFGTATNRFRTHFRIWRDADEKLARNAICKGVVRGVFDRTRDDFAYSVETSTNACAITLATERRPLLVDPCRSMIGYATSNGYVMKVKTSQFFEALTSGEKGRPASIEWYEYILTFDGASIRMNAEFEHDFGEESWRIGYDTTADGAAREDFSLGQFHTNMLFHIRTSIPYLTDGYAHVLPYLSAIEFADALADLKPQMREDEVKALLERFAEGRDLTRREQTEGGAFAWRFWLRRKEDREGRDDESVLFKFGENGGLAGIDFVKGDAAIWRCEL